MADETKQLRFLGEEVKIGDPITPLMMEWMIRMVEKEQEQKPSWYYTAMARHELGME